MEIKGVFFVKTSAGRSTSVKSLVCVV